MRGSTKIFKSKEDAAKGIRAFRDRNDISQAALAAELGITTMSISLYENARHMPMPYLKLALSALEQELKK